ncbi:glycoside hydrolase family 31 protein [Opitutus sp. ER46]|uniref:glycoside hydrolase family 31 protein n=1 Tax=Opitutus sp. ER46 TaxID=2161864 RepID=UPI0018EE8A66|nr:glycoside hydrolase family 31 protein [Opitutus sp. ER46]
MRTRGYDVAADALARLPAPAGAPVVVAAEISSRGVLLRMPLAAGERVYGLGLQLQSFQHRGTKKRLRVNADPRLDTGDSHAPVPFYVTNRGYGVFVDTARYATFYLGNKVAAPPRVREGGATSARRDDWNGVTPPERLGLGQPSEVLIEVPAPARGVDMYLFAGPSLREAVQRYNLFAGGGVVPPRWGLGFWYREHTDATQADTLALAAELRARRVPCDVLGLEPYWQTHAYACSYSWSDRFPAPAEMLAQLAAAGFRVNAWEQAFVHPSAPMYEALLPRVGNVAVWGGVVPDFLDPEARRCFAAHHARLIAEGLAGFKADECDNSDFTGNWSFPEHARFPSGADGEQMHSLLGLRYQEALQAAFTMRRQRTYGLVRSSGALASPLPYVLYSDLYDHRQFVRGLASAGFAGLLWTPEVRDARDPVELVRRIEMAVFSPLMMVNGWYLKHPPWKQGERAANHAGRFAAGWEQVEARVRALAELRMRLVPYLHAAFVRYAGEGLPPFRPLVMDFPDDPAAATIDDEYLVGDALLVAPIIVRAVASGSARAADAMGAARRTVYLPPGDWFDFWTGERRQGGRRFVVSAPLGQTPVFVRSGAVLPLADATLHTGDPASWRLTARVYGDGAREARLYEDDGRFAARLNEVRLHWDRARGQGRVERAHDLDAGTPGYQVAAWQVIGA